jgi:hypothetical protein
MSVSVALSPTPTTSTVSDFVIYARRSTGKPLLSVILA